MTDSRPPVYPELTRPGNDGPAGRLDEALYDLVEARFERLLRDNPILATSMGIHEHDDELGDAGVDALLSEVEADKAHLAMIESLDPDELSEGARFEREMEIHNVRQSTFETEEIRIWERRATALDVLGDGLFLLFVARPRPVARTADRDRRPPRGRADLPGPGAQPGPRPAGPAVAEGRDRVRRGDARVLRRDRRRR